MGIKVVYSRDLSIPASKIDAKSLTPRQCKAREFVRQLGWNEASKSHRLVFDVTDELDYLSGDYFRLLLNVHSREYLLNAKPGWGALKNALANCYALIHATKINFGEKKVIFSPTSGFHHAGYNVGWGFCTFNGLVAAALNLKGKVLILDGDQHFGDGTADIINKLELQDRITNYSIKAWNDIPDFSGYDHIIYQAGADAYYLDGGYATVLEFGYHSKPELGAFSLGDPKPHHFLVAFHVDADGQIDGLGTYAAGITHFNVDAVQIDDRINTIQWTGLPLLDFVHHGISHVRD